MILYFKPSLGDAIKATQFQNIATSLNLEVSYLDEKDLSMKVSELLEGKRGNDTTPYLDKESFALFDLEDEALDNLLVAMREAGFRLNLKAKTTASNKNWTLRALIAHVSEEAEVMQALHKLYQLLNASQTFEYEDHYDKAHWQAFKNAQEEVGQFMEKVGKEEIELDEVTKLTERFNQVVLTLIGKGV